MISFFEIWVSTKYLFPKTKEKFFSLITIFSFLGISLGVATLIIVMSVMNGFREELTSKILGINGHLKVSSKYSNKIKVEKNSYNFLQSKKNILTHEIIISQGLISYKNYSNGVLLKGVNKKFFEERDIFTKKLNQKYLDDFDNNKGVFLGKRLKEKLNLNVGDYITVLSSKSYETFLGNLPRSANFRIVGFFDIGMFEYDTSLIFIPISLLQKFLNYGNNIDHYELVVKDFTKIDNLKFEIGNILPDYLKIIDWRELNPSLFNAIEVERNVMFLILTLIIIVAAFNLISSLMILVSTKKRDIGVLRVLGVTKYQLLKIFIINGFLIGFLGTFLGVFLGLVFCLNINEIRDFIELVVGSNLFSEEIYFFSNLPIILEKNQIFTITLISLSLSLIATIYPSIKATKIEPINLIKWD